MVGLSFQFNQVSRVLARKQGTKSDRVSIYDIAREAGVSIAMVSRVVNNSGPVAKEKRALILSLLKKRNYAPSPAARSLARRQHDTIGVVVHTGPEAYQELVLSRMLAGVSDWCREHHRSLLLMWYEGPDDLDGVIADARAKLDGLLLVDMRFDTELVNALRRESIPFVLVNEPSPQGQEHTVNADDHRGGKLAIEHLLEHGHSHIALVNGSQDVPAARHRRDGALAALTARGLQCPVDWDIDAEFLVDRARKAIRKIFTRDDRPTALFAASDLMAMACIDELNSLGLRVPLDVSIVGYDNSMLAPALHPPLTSVDQCLTEVGKAAARLLHAAHPEVEAEQILIPVALHPRKSVAPVP